MKPEIILNQIVITPPNEAPTELLNAVCCVLIHAAVSNAEYQALLALKAECEKVVDWLYKAYTPENAEDEITLKLASSQLVVKNFLDRLSCSGVPALSRFSSVRIGNSPDNLYIGTATSNE